MATPLPPAPLSTAFVPWEHPATTTPPTTTTEYRPASERLFEYCLANDNGVWSSELQSCFVWFRRARSWDGAMEQCQKVCLGLCLGISVRSCLCLRFLSTLATYLRPSASDDATLSSRTRFVKVR